MKYIQSKFDVSESTARSTLRDIWRLRGDVVIKDEKMGFSPKREFCYEGKTDNSEKDSTHIQKEYEKLRDKYEEKNEGLENLKENLQKMFRLLDVEFQKEEALKLEISSRVEAAMNQIGSEVES